MAELTEGPWSSNWRGFALALGAGYQGKAHKVTRISDGEIGVLKQMKPKNANDPQARARMFRESLILDRFKMKPNLPHLLDTNCSSFKDMAVPLYFVTSFIGGSQLDQFILMRKHIMPEQAIHITIRLLKTLDQLHSLDWPIIHRDIKPANIIMNSKDEPVLIDFGISFTDKPVFLDNGAKGEIRVDEDRNIDDLTEEDEGIGPQFLSLPERRTNQRDARSDVTLACGILFYLLTGENPNGLKKPPHKRPEMLEIFDRLHPDDRANLDVVFDRGFRWDIEKRFQSAQEFIDVLEKVFDSLQQVSQITALARSPLAQYADKQQTVTERLLNGASTLQSHLTRLAHLAKIDNAKLEEMTFLDALEASKDAEHFDGNPIVEQAVYLAIHQFIADLQAQNPGQDEDHLVWYPAVNAYLESRIGGHLDSRAEAQIDYEKESS